MRTDIKGKAIELAEDIKTNTQWLHQEISFVIDGSYDSYELNSYIVEVYDLNKTNRAIRGINLIAKIGNFVITQLYGLDTRQATNAYMYLSEEDRITMNEIIVEELDYYIETIKD